MIPRHVCSVFSLCFVILSTLFNISVQGFCHGVLTAFVCLSQGQSRRVQVEVRSVQDSGTMPLISEIILGVSIGCVEIRQVRMTKNNEPQEVNVPFHLSFLHLAGSCLDI